MASQIFLSIYQNDILGLEKALNQNKQHINDVVGAKAVKKQPDLAHFWSYSPLFLASKLKNLPMIELLLKNGADVNQVIVEDKGGLFISPYDFAILNNHTELIELFNRYKKPEAVVCNIRTKKRPQNTQTLDLKSKKGISQSFSQE